MACSRLHRSIVAALYGGASAVALAPMGSAHADVGKAASGTVVGSHIDRTVGEPSHPVLVLEREDLRRTGLQSLGDILQRLPASGATINTLFNSGGDGSTRVSLRSLGPTRTLVLVNGRRWNTSLSGFVDLNEMPLAIVERVEILKDGASAIYGSDAIAGVINITTRDSHDGAESSAYLGENEAGDGRVEAYDFTIGASTDRANALINVSYTKQEPILAGDREISRVPLFGFSGNNVFAGASSTTPFGRFDGPGIPGTITLIPGRPGCVTGRDCAPGTGPNPARIADFRAFDLATDGFNFAPDSYLSTPQERTALFAHARYQITDTVAFRTEILFNERRSEQQFAPIQLLLGPFFGNPTLLSRDSIYNPFGFDLTRLQYRNTLQPRSFNQDVDTFRFVGGFDGAFDLWDRAFSWDVNYLYADTENRETDFGLFNLANLRTGLGPSFIDPATGRPTCGTPAAPVPGCVPLNFLGGPDGFTREMVDFGTFVAQENTYKKLYNYTANITGDLFELPAGPLAFAAGYEYRREFGFDQPDAFVAGGLSSASIRQPTRGGFDLDEFYGELNIPILKDVPFAEIFEISVAARWSDYSTFGDTTNPKFGFRWKPFADLLVRGNYAEGFRAPTVSELFLGNSDNFQTIFDPCSAAAAPTGAIATRCFGGFGGVGPVPVGYAQTSSQIRVTIGGSPLLSQELARSKTLGLVYSPSWLEGLDVFLDWYNIEITHSIGATSGQFVLDDCYVTGNVFSCALVARTPTGGILELFSGNRNLPNGIESEGYDLTVNYRVDTRYGRFDLNWDTAYLSYFGDLGQPDFGDVLPDGSILNGNGAGRLFDRTLIYNRIRSNINANWDLGDWDASIGARYLSAVDEDCSLPVARGRPALCSNPGGSPQHPDGENRLDETWYFDVQGTWDAPWNARVAVGVRNVTDTDPPVSFATFGGNFVPSYDLPGRFWYVQYTQKF